jgi:transposase
MATVPVPVPTPAPATVGIDVAKAHLDVVVLGSDGRRAHQRVPNTAAGHERLQVWLKQQGVVGVPVCLEATGRYGEAVTACLHQAGYAVSVANPAAVKRFGEALMKRSKTDKVDAFVLARYGALMTPPRWQPPTAVHTELQDLKRLADDLQLDRTRVKNRLEGLRAGSPARPYLEQQLRQLEEQLAQVERELHQRSDQDAQHRQQCALLLSIPGIGLKSALQLLAELPDVHHFGRAEQWVAFAGLCPHLHHSGQQTAVSWLSKQGSARLRHALYFPALSAKQHNPHLRAFAQRLTTHGKPKMVVVAAVMRKLLVLIYAILKSGRPYDPTFGLTA